MSNLDSVFNEMLRETAKEELKQVNDRLDLVNRWIERNLKDQIRVIHFTDNIKRTKKIEGKFHEKLPDLINYLQAGFNVLLTGATGSGKTTGAIQASEALGLPFGAISVGLQTSKSDILGFISASGTYISTPFRDCYEKGGVFIMDEIDAGNSNVLIVLNSALSNGFCNFPDKQVKRHKNFKFVGTANTAGRGRDLHYVGRNALDLATLDRFITIEWGYSQNIEKQLPKEVIDMMKRARKYIDDKNLDGVISTRSGFVVTELIDRGMTLEQATKVALLNKLSQIDYDALITYLFTSDEGIPKVATPMD